MTKSDMYLWLEEDDPRRCMMDRKIFHQKIHCS